MFANRPPKLNLSNGAKRNSATQRYRSLTAHKEFEALLFSWSLRLVCSRARPHDSLTLCQRRMIRVSLDLGCDLNQRYQAIFFDTQSLRVVKQAARSPPAGQDRELVWSEIASISGRVCGWRALSLNTATVLTSASACDLRLPAAADMTSTNSAFCCVMLSIK